MRTVVENKQTKSQIRIWTTPRPAFTSSTSNSRLPPKEQRILPRYLQPIRPRARRVIPAAPEPSPILSPARIEGLSLSREDLGRLTERRASREATVGVWAPRASPLTLLQAESIAAQLAIPIARTKDEAIESFDMILRVTSTRLELEVLCKAPLMQRHEIVYADFVSGKSAFRAKHGGFNIKSPLIKSCLVPKLAPEQVSIVDGTGGLGVDAFVLASIGFKVTIVERDPIVYALLYDAYFRGLQHPETAIALKNVNLVNADVVTWLPTLTLDNQPDVVYLDPMYPPREKMKSRPNKDMMLARRLVDSPVDANLMVEAALKYTKHHVVLKRPKYAPESVGSTKIMRSRGTRFEVFYRQNSSIQ